MRESRCVPEDSPPAWAEGTVEVAGRSVVRVRTELDFRDRIGAWKARWGIGRMRYTAPPGLYAAGQPAPDSPIFVTANYKMSFDRLRAALAGRDGWILVLDTHGINVWCAAGGGLFSTEELLHRAESVRLAEVAPDGVLVLPQLGAPGVAAHEVKRATGRRVVFGPVRARDLGEFLDAGMKAAPGMRRVTFTFAERMAVAPMELVIAGKYALPAAAGLALVSGLGKGGFSFERVGAHGIVNAALLLAVVLIAVCGTAALLPWLPGRAFSVKGAALGLAMAAAAALIEWFRAPVFANTLTAAAWVLMMPAVASFIALNFTGSTPYTSLSGVRKEMRIAVPLQIAAALAGLALFVAGRFR